MGLGGDGWLAKTWGRGLGDLQCRSDGRAEEEAYGEGDDYLCILVAERGKKEMVMYAEICRQMAEKTLDIFSAPTRQGLTVVGDGSFRCALGSVAVAPRTTRASSFCCRFTCAVYQSATTL